MGREYSRIDEDGKVVYETKDSFRKRLVANGEGIANRLCFTCFRTFPSVDKLDAHVIKEHMGEEDGGSESSLENHDDDDDDEEEDEKLGSESGTRLEEETPTPATLPVNPVRDENGDASVGVQVGVGGGQRTSSSLVLSRSKTAIDKTTFNEIGTGGVNKRARLSSPEDEEGIIMERYKNNKELKDLKSGTTNDDHANLTLLPSTSHEAGADENSNNRIPIKMELNDDDDDENETRTPTNLTKRNYDDKETTSSPLIPTRTSGISGLDKTEQMKTEPGNYSLNPTEWPVLGRNTMLDPSSSSTKFSESGINNACVEVDSGHYSYQDEDEDEYHHEIHEAVEDNPPPMPALSTYFMEEYVDKPLIPMLEVEDVDAIHASLSTIKEDSEDSPCEMSCDDEPKPSVDSPGRYATLELLSTFKHEVKLKTRPASPIDDEPSSSSLTNNDDADEADDERERLMWCKLCDTYYRGLDDLKSHVKLQHHRDPSRINRWNYATWDLKIAQTCCRPDCQHS